MNSEREALLMSFKSIDMYIEEMDIFMRDIEDYYPEHTLWWEEQDCNVFEDYFVSEEQLANFDWEEE